MTTFEIAQALAAQSDLIKLLLDKLNRIEAATAHAKPVKPVSKGETIDVAVELLDRAIAANERQNESFRTMMMDIRRDR
jgi:hypothetical protein